MPEAQTKLERAIELANISFADWPQPISNTVLMDLLERGVQKRWADGVGAERLDIRGANALMKVAAVHLRAIFDHENQPSQFGTQLLSE